MDYFFRPQASTAVCPAEVPALVLVKDSWDDYSHKLSFDLYYFDEVCWSERVGSVKILHKHDAETELPSRFSQLPDDFISLGQKLAYYSRLTEIMGAEQADQVLRSLNDIAWRPTLSLPFEALTGFRNGLLRFNSAQKAKRFGRAAILGEPIREDFSFTYAVPISPGSETLTVSIDFDGKDNVPGRVAGIIGRNATGKTRFLSMLAEDLVQISRSSQERLKERDDRFTPSRPIFTRLVTISYSAFDRFRRPLADHASYVYCGIRTEKGGLSMSHLRQTFADNMKRVRGHGRADEWMEAVEFVLGEDGADAVRPVAHDVAVDDEELLGRLSSGQAILVHCLTAVLAWIEEDSLILFDEPETHLHPNAVAALFWILNFILRNHKSYALIATHSPIVIQQIPSKRVIVFERSAGASTARKIEVESFGESVSELTRHVFETNETPSFFKDTLRRLSKNRSFDEVVDLFGGELSLNARSYLLAQYESDDV